MIDRFSYYGSGRLIPIDSKILKKRGVHKFMLEEMVKRTAEKLEEKLSNEISTGLYNLRKEMVNEVKKINQQLKRLIVFQEKIEKKERKEKVII